MIKSLFCLILSLSIVQTDMGLQKEIWEGEMLQRLRNIDEGHLAGIPDYSGKIIMKKGGAIIHLVDLGQDPGLLVNNTVYPINSAQRTDRDITISLDKIETENTTVTDDELEGLPYDKQNSVIQEHQGTLAEGRLALGTHGLGPDADTATTPLLPTTGANDDDGTFKKLTPRDLTLAQLRFDKLNIPAGNRIAVLSPEHCRDLLDADQKFQNQWHIIQSGRPVDMYGFKLYKYNANPFYAGANEAAWAKQAFGVANNNGVGTADTRHRHATLFYYTPRLFKAMGGMNMYYAKAEENPSMRESEVGFRTYSIVQPKLPQSLVAADKSPHSIGAIVAAEAA